MDKIKIIVTDDHQLIREGLIKLLSLDDAIEIIGEADNGDRALSLIKSKSPDVLLLDVNMPRMNGIETLQELKNFEIIPKVLMLTAYDDRKHLKDAYIMALMVIF